MNGSCCTLMRDCNTTETLSLFKSVIVDLCVSTKIVFTSSNSQNEHFFAAEVKIFVHIWNLCFSLLNSLPCSRLWTSKSSASWEKYSNWNNLHFCTWKLHSNELQRRCWLVHFSEVAFSTSMVMANSPPSLIPAECVKMKLYNLNVFTIHKILTQPQMRKKLAWFVVVGEHLQLLNFVDILIKNTAHIVRLSQRPVFSIRKACKCIKCNLGNK